MLKRLTYADLGPPGIGLPDDPAVGDTVYKSGRRSGATSHTVFAPDMFLAIILGNQLFGFSNQTLISPGILNGDSGSALFDTRNNIVGLLFAGDSFFAYANRATEVMMGLGLSIQLCY